jgi:microcystin degradation protein MlrC
MLIAIGGVQHETNTFAAAAATFADFEAPDAWPGLVRGPALFEAVRGINLPAAGFIDEARSAGHTLLPLTWCSATPSGPVTREAYETIVAMLLEDLGSYSALDAVYLDLHGAMVAEHVDDADGELLRRVRNTVGPSIPVIASLDFHANVSRQMVEQASALIAYRTYPHVDMSDTGVRTMRCLYQLRSGTLARRFRQLPFLIPLTSQCTLVEPLSLLQAEVASLEQPPIFALNFTPGFPAADVAECGPAVFGYGATEDDIAKAVDRVADMVSEREAEFALEIYSVAAAIQELARAPTIAGRPIVLADTQDNPGGGGSADTTALLKALISRGTRRVLAGIICDPQAAAHAHEAGLGAHIDLRLGAHSQLPAGMPAQEPIEGRYEVVALGDGRFTGTGPFYRGARMDLGPMALLCIDDVYIAVASRKQQAADQAMFRHLGAEPKDFAVLALKSSVHFRADFGSIAQRILVVDAPGSNIADPGRLPFKKLRPGVRLSPRR